MQSGIIGHIFGSNAAATDTKNYCIWVSTKFVKHAKCVGTMIVPQGHLHRLNVPWKKFIQRARKVNETSKSLVERLVDFKNLNIYMPCQCLGALGPYPHR